VRLGQEVQALPRRALERRVGAAPEGSLRPPNIEPRTVLVVAAALYDGSGRILIAERPQGKHLAGHWEFPGGKVGEGEPEAEALARELREELGVGIEAAHPLLRVGHDYPDKRVELSFWIVERFTGTPRGLEGQRLRWLAPSELQRAGILEADRAFVEALAGLPPP
jgi:8-oxo-dGTP diphosphatase